MYEKDIVKEPSYKFERSNEYWSLFYNGKEVFTKVLEYETESDANGYSESYYDCCSVFVWDDKVVVRGKYIWYAYDDCKSYKSEENKAFCVGKLDGSQFFKYEKREPNVDFKEE